MEAQSVLNKTQLEILQMFRSELAEEELKELKRMFTEFLAKKAEILANRVWEEKGWSNEEMKRISQEHLRTPYKRKT